MWDWKQILPEMCWQAALTDVKSNSIHLHSLYEVKVKGLAPDHLTEVTEINGFSGHVWALQRVCSALSTSVFLQLCICRLQWERKYMSLTRFPPRHADMDKFTVRFFFFQKHFLNPPWLKIIPSLCWSIINIHATTFLKMLLLHKLFPFYTL